MAATLEVVSSPNPIVEVGNCIKWAFIMTGVSDDEQESRFVYWIEDETGQKLTYPEQLIPGDGVEFSIDLVKDIRNRLYPSIPDYQDLFSSGFLDKPTLSKQILFNYQVISFNKLTCETEIVDEQVLPEVLALGIAGDWFYPIEPGDTKILNPKASLNLVHIKSNDWLYVYGPGVVVDITAYKGSTIIGDYSATSSGDRIQALPIGPDNLRDQIPEDTTHYVVSTEGFTWTYQIDCRVDYVDLYYWANGFNVLTMKADQTSIESSQSLVNQYNPECSPLSQQGLTTRGLGIIGKKAYFTHQLSKLLDSEVQADVLYLSRALSSPLYYLQVDYIGSSRIIKFIVNTNSSPVLLNDGFTTLVITGRLNRDFTGSNTMTP